MPGYTADEKLRFDQFALSWIVHYCVKNHVSKMPYGIVALKPRLFPGDTILETGEVVPDLPEADSHGHH